MYSLKDKKWTISQKDGAAAPKKEEHKFEEAKIAAAVVPRPGAPKVPLPSIKPD